MIEFANKQKSKSKLNSNKLELFHEDIVNYQLNSSDLIISYFTIQFIHPKHP